MNIYILRHGETDFNKDRVLQGSTDVPLNENGRTLAKEVGKGCAHIRFDICYTSPLSRARETAQLFLHESGNENTPTVFDPRIAEIDGGDMEGKSVRTHPVWKEFFVNPLPLPAFPNGESVWDVMARTADFLADLKKQPYENVLVSTHGCATRALLRPFYDDQNDFWQGQIPPNCCINILKSDHGEFSLVERDKIFARQEENKKI